jgi:hypothetical protein
MPDRELIADSKAVIAFSYSRVDGGTISMSYQGWEQSKVILPGQAFEVRAGPQGIEGRIRNHIGNPNLTSNPSAT